MLKKRVAERLEALNISQWEAAERARKNRNFVYDILQGRKIKPQRRTLIDLARALECSVEYLLGESDEIGFPPALDRATDGMDSPPVVGVIEEGAWRSNATVPGGTVKVARDPRYAGRQSLFVYRGADFDGFSDGMMVLVVDFNDYLAEVGNPPAQHPVLVRLKRRALKECQRIIRPWSTNLASTLTDQNAEAIVEGVVASTFRLY
jgi:transcriptional regulator with XRE-family HTH domain